MPEQRLESLTEVTTIQGRTVIRPITIEHFTGIIWGHTVLSRSVACNASDAELDEQSLQQLLVADPSHKILCVDP